MPKIFVNGQSYFDLSSKMWSHVFLEHSVVLTAHPRMAGLCLADALIIIFIFVPPVVKIPRVKSYANLNTALFSTNATLACVSSDIKRAVGQRQPSSK